MSLTDLVLEIHHSRHLMARCLFSRLRFSGAEVAEFEQGLGCSARVNLKQKPPSIIFKQHLFEKKMNVGKPKVLVAQRNPPEIAIKMLEEKCEVEVWKGDTSIPRNVVLQSIKGKDAVFLSLSVQVDKELLDAAGPNLKVIGTMSVGYDHIDVPEVKKRNIKVGYTPGVLNDAVAELTVAILLASSRRLFETNHELVTGGWGPWDPQWKLGVGLEDSTVGIVGFGRIGQATARCLKPFNVAKFLYSGHNPKPEAAQYDAKFVSFEELLQESDFVICTSPLNAETKEMFNAKAFSLMKSTAVFVNTSRGGLVDQKALYDALKNHKIFSAALDVMTPEPIPPDHELTKLPNCVLVPHIGSGTVQARTKMATLTSENILCALEGKPMPAQLC